MPIGNTGNPGVFNSFWMGGYEGADHVNGLGDALDMADASGHLEQLEEDHRRAAKIGIGTIRESVGWRLTESRAGSFDLDRARRIASSADRHGLQVIWTLMHYGTPPDVTLLHDSFCGRFVEFAVAVARAVGPLGSRPPVYNLINEISFLAWAVSATNLVHPYWSDPGNGDSRTIVSGYDVKCRMVRATLAATSAIRRIDPSARFLQVEPVIHIVAAQDRPEDAEQAARASAYQWETWDLLSGRTDIGQGGHVEALDLVGVNHYHSGQWEDSTGWRLDWDQRDARRLPLSKMLEHAWSRYERPLIIAETSHFGEGRSRWLNEVASEVLRARSAGVSVEGICLYPLIDRPDWNDPAHWHRSGMWDVDISDLAIDTGADPPSVPATAPPRRRVLCADYAATLQRWQAALPNTTNEGKQMNCLIVLSHLRWNFVYQRPQHLMSRLAGNYRVIFVEEPLHTDGEPRLERISQGPNLEVLIPHTSSRAAGFDDEQLPVLASMLGEFLADEGIERPLVWFYTPMALPLLSVLNPRGVVYDCMDELSAFKNAPQQLREREAALFSVADLVLTGGPALYEAKQHLHKNVHCLPSSVEAEKYAPSKLDRGSAHAFDAQQLQAGMPRPRLGFFGVIDERFDIPSLALMAEMHPEWQLVMVGPVVKIDPADLPTSPNVHWLGMQPYERLPYLMADWDVCLMPFALNESTRFISPTKTLEYMAGEKSIVSTPVHDVASLYANTVRIAAGGLDFVNACEQALAEDSESLQRRIGEMITTVSRSSWDRSAEKVGKLLLAIPSKNSSTLPAAIPSVPRLKQSHQPSATIRPAQSLGQTVANTASATATQSAVESVVG